MPIDYKRYPWDWFSRIIPALKARSNDCCEECHRVNGSIVWSVSQACWRHNKKVYRQIWFSERPDYVHNKIKSVRVVLTAAHLDHDEWNNAVPLERLRYWCQLCHLKYDSTVHQKRRECGTGCTYPHCDLKATCVIKCVPQFHP
jgi:hypothetical protein